MPPRSLNLLAHRLELLYNGDDVIIDDAYNGNESGALNALRVLNSFAPRTRVLITPGLVELGARQEEANRRLGAQAYQNCVTQFLSGLTPKFLSAEPRKPGLSQNAFFR